MRIAYLTDIDIGESSGVLYKHLMQCHKWLDNHHHVKIFCIPCRENIQPLAIDVDYEIFYTPFVKYVKGPAGVFLNKLLATKKIIKSIGSFKADIVYLRSTTWYPGLDIILKSFPTVIEFNTLLEDEIKLTFSKKMQKVHFYGKDKLYKYMAGLVGVTQEITDHYISRYHKPAITIANGFDVFSVPLPVARESSRPQVIFVGTPGYVWHGVDKFIKMAQLISEIDFHLVGPVVDGVEMDNLVQHGYLSKPALTSLYSQMDIGVGSLALHRNQLNEASPLKVREYSAHGLPLILAYIDTDLSGQDFVLQLENTENTIENNIPAIKAFIFKWRGHKIPRDLIVPLIDYSLKEKRRLDFFKTVIKQ